MSEEKKDFIVNDRRSLDKDGQLKEKDTKETDNITRKEKKAVDPPPLPEVNFTSFIFSLSSTAIFHLGDIPDPQTGEKTMDLMLAKNTIDTISMLKDKTKGNLTEEEQKLTDSILADLRWRFVKAKK